MVWKDYDKYSVLYLHNYDEASIAIYEHKNNRLRLNVFDGNWNIKIQSTNLDDAKVEAEKYVTEVLTALG